MSTNREALGRLVPSLPEEIAGEVLDFARARLEKERQDDARNEGYGEALLAAILADPEKKARFEASILEAYARADRGESLDGDAVMDELLDGLPE